MRNTEKDDAKIFEIRSRYGSTILRQLALAARLEHRDIELLKGAATDAGIISLRENAIVGYPWQSEVNLLSKEEGFTRYPAKIHIRNNILYCHVVRVEEHKHHVERKHHVACINLQTFDKRYIPINKGNFLYVDDINIYCQQNFGENKGLYVYPHDISKPWSLTLQDGLPDEQIHILGTLDGWCYATCGRDWIIRIDLKTKQWEQLSSSTAKTGKTPFVNGNRLGDHHLGNYRSMDDLNREQILLFLGNSLWSIKKGGEFMRLQDCLERRYLNPSFEPLEFFDNGDKLLLHAMGRTRILDCNTSMLSDVELMGTVGISDGYFWGSIVADYRDARWARQSRTGIGNRISAHSRND